MTTYASYIKSKKWQARRVAFFHARGGRVCQACGTSDDVQVHHRSYERLGRETDDDLRAVCQRCHDAIHQLHRSRDALTLPEATDSVLDMMQRRVARGAAEPVAVGRQPSSIDRAVERTRERQRKDSPAPPWEGLGSNRGKEITKRRQRVEAERLVDQLLGKAARGTLASALTPAEQRLLEQALKTLRRR